MRVLIPALVLAITLAGCSSEVTTEEDSYFAEFIDTAIADAEAGGASEQQLAILEEAREVGEVTLEQMREATRAAIECFLGAGLLAEYSEETLPHGVVLPGYSVGVVGDFSEAQDLAATRCDDENAFWVDKVYQGQPSSEALWADFLDSKAAEFRACLEAAGYETDPDATGSDLVHQTAEIYWETNLEVDCYFSIVDGDE